MRSPFYKINAWISRQPYWVDDLVHVALGFSTSVLVYIVLYYVAVMLWPTWGLPAVSVPIIAFLTPVALGVIEEATNVRPDYWHDIPGYAVGSLLGVSLCLLVWGL